MRGVDFEDCGFVEVGAVCCCCVCSRSSVLLPSLSLEVEEVGLNVPLNATTSGCFSELLVLLSLEPCFWGLLEEDGWATATSAWLTSASGDASTLALIASAMASLATLVGFFLKTEAAETTCCFFGEVLRW